MQSQNVPNYLPQAILTTLFCCLPFGIVAIVYAAQVNTKLQAGDYEGAMQSSKSAKTWCWVSFGSGLAVFLIYFLLIILASLAPQ
jgi:Interferon-induced transmembrane protein